MKNVLIILGVLLFCVVLVYTNPDELFGTKKPEPEDRNTILTAQAKIYADSVFYHMNQGVNKMVNTTSERKKKIIRKEFGDRTNLFQAKLDSIKAKLPADKVKEIDDYRQKLYNEVVLGTYNQPR